MKYVLPPIDQLNRLAKAVMQQRRINYEEALAVLSGFRIHFSCPTASARRLQYQAALLTAINVGKRAFLGGVTVQVSSTVLCALPGWTGRPLHVVAQELGAKIVHSRPETEKVVWLGAGEDARPGDLILVADDWRGGFVPAGTALPYAEVDGGALGGVFAAGLTVARMFVETAGVAPGACDTSYGLSLWRPDLPWTDGDARGPVISRWPEKLWLLGLGHLGQAYLWTLGLLPFDSNSGPLLYLHDFDQITTGNWSAGLLCEENLVGKLKTRVCAEWVEHRGFKTRCIERPFDANTKVNDGEPRVALCGFDNSASRRPLESSGFDLVVECGLGSSLDQFDRLMLHTFPDASQRPQDIWADAIRPETSDFDPKLFGVELAEGECGVLLDELARKPIAASFVGAASAALVIAELLRGLHGGNRYELVLLHLRSDWSLRAVVKPEIYQRRHAVNGILRPAA